jgi:colanic acid biosynthesis glycosyl transferase WcaI
MRLLFIINHFLPDRGGGGAVYSDLCFGLAERGVDVTVYCPVPFYPEWKDKCNRNGVRFWRYRESGVEIVRYGFFIPNDPRSLIQRLAFEASLVLSLARLVPLASRFDGVMVFCPYFSAVIVATIMKALFRRPLWLNVQDVVSDAAVDTGMVRSRAFGSTLRFIERVFYNRADVWSTISPVMMRKLEGFRSRAQPILFLPNWVDRLLSAEMERLGLDRERTLHAPVRLLYAGNIGRKQGLLELCRFLHALETPFEFRIFGDGAGARELVSSLKEMHDSRFHLGHFLDAGRLAEELTTADFYVISEQPGTSSSFFPSKLVTGMAAGTPILAICDPASPLAQEMYEAEPGPCLQWTELSLIEKLLRDYDTLTAEWPRWRRNAFARAALYDREAILDGLKRNMQKFVVGAAMSNA